MTLNGRLEKKHEPVSDFDTVVVDSLKALDPEWPIREADMRRIRLKGSFPQVHLKKTHLNVRHATARLHPCAVV